MNALPKLRGPTQSLMSTIKIPEKLLSGPGPSNLAPEVAEVMSSPILGHLHPEFTQIMDDVKDGIRYLFQTQSRYAVAVSGTGHMAMEVACFNMLEPGEKVLVLQNGLWGERFADMASRCGVEPVTRVKPAGKVFDLDEVEQMLAQVAPQAVFVVHGESSAGTLQPLVGLGPLCHKFGSNLIVDAVVTAGGCPLLMDDWELDCVYSGSQKCLNCCPGISPIAFSERAQRKMLNRKQRVLSWYMDMKEIGDYWACGDVLPRKYHHTAPVNLVYGLREALRMVASEGLVASWERHQAAADRLVAGLQDLGLTVLVEEKDSRVPCLTTVCVPPNTDWKAVTMTCMEKDLVEISGGLGPTAGKVWRIGLMGRNATPSVVDRILSSLKAALEIHRRKL